MDDLILPEERHLWLCRERDPEDLAEKILYFYENRPVQHLTEDQDIDKLVERFCGQIEQLSRGDLRQPHGRKVVGGLQ